MTDNGVNSAKSAARRAEKGKDKGKLLIISTPQGQLITEYYDKWLKTHNLNNPFKQQSWPDWKETIKTDGKTPEDKWKREYMKEPLSDE